jgi:hypothetical protein
MIKAVIEKLIKTEKRISKNKGDFNFFGILKNSKLEDSWDIIISADWFSETKQKDLIYIIEEIKKDLKNEDLRLFTKLFLMKPEEDLIKKLNILIETQHEMVEMIDAQMNEIKLGHIYIITSKKQPQLT